MFWKFQLLPEQAAFYLNEASRVSILTSKSPKEAVGFPLPGHESYPENNSAIKMLEAAMQRLTNLFSVLKDMEPICVLNHVFVPREYMREGILTVIGFCIEGGQALAFDQLLAEAAGLVLGEGAPLIYSLLSGVAKHIPEEIYGKKEIRRIQKNKRGGKQC